MRLIIILCCISFNFLPVTYSCSLVLHYGPSVMVGRNMDWPEDLQTSFMIFPRGIARDGLVVDNPIHWVSRYGSLVASSSNESIVSAVTEGMNEAGLGVHLLSLDHSSYGERNVKIPGLSIFLWAQFYLDNFKNVAEAVRFTQNNTVQVVPFFYPKFQRYINLHLALEDSQGDSAVIEYIDGSAHIYHGLTYTILTNDPSLDLQLLNLNRYQGFGGQLSLPGSTLSTDRFVRAQYYSKYLKPSHNDKEEVFSLFSILENVAQPVGIPSPERALVSTTLWQMVGDLTHLNYYYHSRYYFNTIWVSLSQFNLQKGSPIMKLDLDNELVGNVADQFKKI